MLKRFIINILAFSIIISIIAVAVFNFLLPQFYLSVFPFLILFFVLVTIGIHAILTKAGKRTIRQFSTFYMGSVTAKLFIYLTFLVAYTLTHKEQAVPFILTFFILYVLFTFFETLSLLNSLKNQTPSEKKSDTKPL
jgi:hypothetical protein